MPIKISDRRKCLEIDGTTIATDIGDDSGWWVVACWPQLLRRGQVVAGLIVTERPASGYNTSDRVVTALRSELLR
jgi:hypothetical protein